MTQSYDELVEKYGETVASYKNPSRKWKDYYLGIVYYSDKYDVLFLQSKGERIDIFMLALSIGVREGYRTKSSKSEGLILEATAKGKDSVISLILSVALQELKKQNKEEEINNSEIVYGIAEEYANTGFSILEKIFSNYTTTKDDSTTYKLIEMLDEKFDDIINKEKE
jgi:hypothetical protein